MWRLLMLLIVTLPGFSLAQWTGDWHYVRYRTSTGEFTPAEASPPKQGPVTLTLYADANWADDVVAFWQAPTCGCTLVSLDATVFGVAATSLTFQVEERAHGSLASSGSECLSDPLIADADGSTVSTFADSNIAARAHLVFIGDVATGTVDYVTISVYWR